MQTDMPVATVSVGRLRAGRILSGLFIAFLTFDSIIKILKIQPVLDAFKHLGIPENLPPVIGILALVCIALYAYPPTSVLGAVLLTGYLGGAVVSHLRVGDPLFSTVLFPVLLGTVVWGGLLLRDPRLRAVFPVRR